MGKIDKYLNDIFTEITISDRQTNTELHKIRIPNKVVVLVMLLLALIIRLYAF